MQVVLDRTRCKKRLAQPGDSRVCLHDQPQQVVVLAEADGFERGDVHAAMVEWTL